MTYENNLKTIIENKKPVELVYELKDEYQIPSFEEFMKNYEIDEKINDNYELEVNSYGDVRIPRDYGPGNNMSREQEDKLKKGVTGVVTGIGIAALTVACPPAGGAAAAVVGGAGAGAKVAKNFVPKDSDLNEALDSVGDIYEIAGTVGGAPSGARWVKNVVTGKTIIR